MIEKFEQEETGSDKAVPVFLENGGEMAALIRQFNWPAVSIGGLDQWPQSLRSLVSMLLPSKFPMLLMWGPELIHIYNDAFRPSLGVDGKHPSSLGQKATEVWPEIWDTIKPLFDQVLSGGESVWHEDALIPIYRNGRIEQVYWTFSYSAVRDETDKINGIMVVCCETTEKVTVIKRVSDTITQLSFAIDAAELGTWDLDPETFKFTGNRRLKEWFGLEADEEIELDLAMDAISEKDRPRVNEAIQHALQFASGGNYEIEYNITNAKTGQQRMVRAKGKALFDEHDKPYRFNGTLQDITQEISAREQRQKLLTLVDNSVDLMSILELNGTNSYINRAGREILGIDPDADVTIIPISDFHTPEQIVFVESEIIPNVMSKGRWAGQFAIRNAKTGEIIPLYNNCHRIDDIHTGAPIGVGAVMRDMRPELNAQKEMAANEERLNIAIDTTELGMYELDMVTDNLIYNQRYLEIFGFDNDEKPPHAELIKHMHPEDMGLRAAAMKRALETGSLDMEMRIVHTDDSIRWIKAKGKVFYDDDLVPVKQLGTIMDITAHKNAIEAYALSNDRFRLLADSMPQFIWTGDTEGNLNYYSQAVYDYSGLTPEKLEKDGWLQIVHPDDRDENVNLWIESIQTGNPFLFEHRFRRHDGEYRWQLSRALAQRDEEGRIRMWVGTSTDIHDQKIMSKKLEQNVAERTRELQEANTELEKKNQELASFAYVSSHDLQEPLRKISTFISRIEKGSIRNLDETDRDYFERIKRSATRMQVLITDLLSFSQTNTSDKEFVNTDLNKLLKDILSDLRDTIQKTGAVIYIDKLPEMTVISFQFYQLFDNLISNAIKFSKPGEPPHINISGNYVEGDIVHELGAQKGSSYYHIIVEDKGIGFEEQYKDRIFEVFQRLHGRSEYAGTGIGLAICKKIVENHHGFLTAESEPGSGARFHIYLPVHK
jgi:PAS domain S-box-containing protein